MDEFDRSENWGMKEADGLISVSKGAQFQTVLIARTGVEDGLSAPISFESLQSHSLPLRSYDLLGLDFDIVRVSIPVAVKFVASLEAQEELAFAKSQGKIFLDGRLHPSNPKGFEWSPQTRYSPETWANATIVAAEKHGFDNIIGTRSSIRRVQADLVGENYQELKHYPWRPQWKY